MITRPPRFRAATDADGPPGLSRLLSPRFPSHYFHLCFESCLFLFFNFVFRSNPITYINENVDREHIREFLQSITDEIHIAGTAQDYAYGVRVRACVRRAYVSLSKRGGKGVRGEVMLHPPL